MLHHPPAGSPSEHDVPRSGPHSRSGRTRAWWSQRATAFALALALLTSPGALAAQTGGVIAGTVVSERGVPLSDAQVAVDGQVGTGSTTDAAGRFRLVGVSGTGQVTSPSAASAFSRAR
jgi:hypothetical protein